MRRGPSTAVESSAGRSEQQQGAGRLGRLHRVEDRLRQQDHAGAAAERRVVDRPVHVRGELPQIVDPDVDNPALARLAEEASGQGGLEQPREDREDVDAHGLGGSSRSWARICVVML